MPLPEELGKLPLDPSSAQKIKFTKWGSTLGVLTGVPTSTCELEV